MREFIRIVESAYLSEVRVMDAGDTPRTVLRTLNVFDDLIGMDNEGITGGLDPKFLKRYKKLASAMAKRIEALPNLPLSPMMYSLIDSVYHRDPETHFAPEEYQPGDEKQLATVYGKQLAALEKVVGELEKMQGNDELRRKEMITGLLWLLKQEWRVYQPDKAVMTIISKMRAAGIDYPEFATIEKSAGDDHRLA